MAYHAKVMITGVHSCLSWLCELDGSVQCRIMPPGSDAISGLLDEQ